MLSSQTVACLFPELVLVLTATLVYLGGAFWPGRHWGRASLLGIAGAALTLAAQYNKLFWTPGATQPLLSVVVGGPLVVDLLGQFVRWLALLVGALFLLTSQRPSERTPSAEASGTLLMAVAGTMLVGSAQELTLMFLGLELVSIPTYILLYLGRGDRASQESTVKYFFLSILSSALLLYGFSFLYGMAGSTHLADIRNLLIQHDMAHGGWQWIGRLALALVLAGLGFRITAVPFHFYAPDVYQGTTHANAGLLSVVPKMVAVVALVRIVGMGLPGFESLAWRAVLVMSLLTMTLGNVSALWQNQLRRMLAYSSIAHGGYLLIGLATFLADQAGATASPAFGGMSASLFYLGAYALATAGTFASLTYLSDPEKSVDTLDDLAGAGRAHPVAGAVLAICMFSLAGIPPLAGFWGKLALFFSALGVETVDPSDRRWFIALAIVGALNAAIGAAYYLRVIAAAYFRPVEQEQPASGGRGAAVAMVAAAVLVVYVGLFPTAMQRGADSAARSVVNPLASTTSPNAATALVTSPAK